MSHFSVLVISDTELNEQTLEPILQPWHEYECTGKDDQYVVPVDITDKVLEEFNDPQKVVIVRRSVYSRWDDRFYTKTPEKKDILDSGRKEFELPKGGEEKEIPADEARKHGLGYLTMEQCAKEYFGDRAYELGGRYFRRTNPNSKWDWWQVGGRWSGMFIPGYDPNEDPNHKETCWLCQGTGKRDFNNEIISCNGCSGTGIATKWPTQWKTDGNISQMKNLPIAELRIVAQQRAAKHFDTIATFFNGMDPPDISWLDLEGEDFAKARDAFWEDNKALFSKMWKAKIYDPIDAIKAYKKGHGACLQEAMHRALQTFAIVKDGKWYERGEMGWWGAVHNEKDREQWDREFEALIDGLSPDTWLAVVDCHI